MTDLASNAEFESPASDIRVVKMRGFGIGERSTVPISIATAIVIARRLVGGLRGAARAASLPADPRRSFQRRDIVLPGRLRQRHDVGACEREPRAHPHRCGDRDRARRAGRPSHGLSRWAKGVFDTPIEFYWPLPPLAYLPLMIIWLGIGEASKITLLTMAMFAPIAIAAQAGVRSVSLERVNAALSLGANRFQLMRDVVLPSALPEILTGTRIAMGVGWSTLVAAELIAATQGIGHFVMSASQFLATDYVFVGIGVIAVCAFAFSFGMRLLERWLVPWKGQS